MTAPRLAGEVALITGGAAGIGAATAALFAREGASLLLVDAQDQVLQDTARVLRAQGAQVQTLLADVSDESAAAAAVALATASFGRLSILVNNAAMRHYGPLPEAKTSDWQAVVAVNLLGVANYCRAALPALRQSRGCVVNVSSCYAVTGREGMGLYDATKAAQLAMTRTLAFEEAPLVRVNAVCPGSTLTDFHVQRARAAGKDVAQLKTERQTTSLLGRWAEPAEIAAPILWLASSEASFITGTTLIVDGGLSIM